MPYVKVIILRQASTGLWEKPHEQAWAAAGEFIDNAAIDTTWRYSAITTITGTGVRDAASNAGAVKELEYGLCTYGILGYRGYLSEYWWTPPGRDLVGSAPRDDWFRTVIRPSDGQTPAFLPVNPALPSGEDAPLTFTKEGKRYFPEAAPVEFHTELSTKGYIIRQRPFKIQALARVSGLYQGCLLELTALNATPQLTPDGTIKIGNDIKQKYNLDPVEVEVRGTHYEGFEDAGFDSATYFASQHLRGGVAASLGTRRLNLRYRGGGAYPALSTVGPVQVTNETGVDGGTDFDLKATGSALDETGKVLEAATNREVKAVTLPPKGWTIGIYPTLIYDSYNGVYHYPPPLPDAATLQAELNDIYGRQANVTFTVILKPQITVDTANFGSPPFSPYPHPVSEMKSALWNASNKEDLVLFWVDEMEEGTAAQVFRIVSRGAVIGPDAGTKAVAHELGHCFGLSHCWRPDSDSSLANIADLESKRLMGYGSGGKILRSKEILKVNAWKRPDKPLGEN